MTGGAHALKTNVACNSDLLAQDLANRLPPRPQQINGYEIGSPRLTSHKRQLPTLSSCSEMAGGQRSRVNAISRIPSA